MFQNVLTDERSRADLDVAVGCKARSNSPKWRISRWSQPNRTSFPCPALCSSIMGYAISCQVIQWTMTRFGYLYCFMSMPVACVWECAHSCQRKMLAFFLCSMPLHSLEAGSLTEPDACHFGWTGCPERSLEMTTISASASSPVLGLQAHIAMPDFYIGAGDLNSHPPASIARSHYPLSHHSNPGAVVLKWWLDCL